MPGKTQRLRAAFHAWGTIPVELRAGIPGLIATLGAVVVTTFNDLSATEQYLTVLGAGGGTCLAFVAIWALAEHARASAACRESIRRLERALPTLAVGAARWNGTEAAYVDEGVVRVVEAHVGVATSSTPNSVSMFYLEVAGHRWAVATVEPVVTPNPDGYRAVYDDGNLGYRTMLAGPFLELPLRLAPDDAGSGWIAFLPFSRVTFAEARSHAAFVVAACANGEEVRTEVRIPPPPAERTPA